MILFHNDENISIKDSPLICYHFPQKWLSKLIFLFILNFGRVMEPHGSLRPRISVKQQHAAFVNLSYIFQPDSIFPYWNIYGRCFSTRTFCTVYFTQAQVHSSVNGECVKYSCFHYLRSLKNQIPMLTYQKIYKTVNLKYICFYIAQFRFVLWEFPEGYSIGVKRLILISVGQKVSRKRKSQQNCYFCF